MLASRETQLSRFWGFLVTLALMTTLCASAHERVPREIYLTLPIHTDGWGMMIPLTKRSGLTAAHMFSKPELDTATSPPEKRVFRLLRKNEKLDLAEVVLLNGPDMKPLKIAKSLPEPGDEVFTLVYINDHLERAPVIGRFMKLNYEGDLVVDGFGAFGMSGGPLLNSDGEVIGVMHEIFVLAPQLRTLSLAVNLVKQK